MIDRPWWEQFPGRLERELQALTDAGIHFERDEHAFKKGIIKLRLEHEVDGQRHRFEAVFPDLYPYFRFELAAPDVQLPYHQHPQSKNLCLMGRPTHYWNTDDTLADLLKSQLPSVFQTALCTNVAEVAGREQAQAEPFGDFYPCGPSMVFVDGAWTIPISERSGPLEIGLRGKQGQIDNPFIHGAVLQVQSDSGVSLARADEGIHSLYSGTRLNARWFRADHPISIFDPKEFFEAVERMDPSRRRKPENRWGNASLQIWGVVYPEEVAHRQQGQGWVFVFQRRRQTTTQPSKEFPRTVRVGQELNHQFARAGRAGPSDIRLRTPELAPLATKEVALFGLGCIGAPMAIEFAKAGVRGLRVVDDDVVDPGTIGRWPLGLSTAGHLKGEVVLGFIQTNYPGVRVSPCVRRLGVPRDPGEDPESERDLIRAVVEGVSLICDTTAEVGVQHFLSDLARSLGIPYMSVTGSFGGWGGAIVRITPGRTQGCWLCTRHAFEDGTIPYPPSDADKMVQPLGCGNPTFTGAGFDLGEVALAGVRTAVSTLCDGEQGGYPSCDWDVITIAFRDYAGSTVSPTYQTFKLKRHPSCPRCNSQAHEPAADALACG